MKGDGLYRRGGVWWMTYVTPDGKRHQGSTGKHYHAEAKVERDRVMGDVAHGRPVATPGKLNFEDLSSLIRTDYDVHRRRTRRALDTTLKQLARFFGHRKAASI